MYFQPKFYFFLSSFQEIIRRFQLCIPDLNQLSEFLHQLGTSLNLEILTVPRDPAIGCNSF